MNKKINLAVIFGGRSSEHEVSLSSAKGVMDALDKEKYNVIPIAITKKGNWLVGTKGAEYMKLHAQSAGKEGAISIEASQSLVTIKEEERGIMRYAEGDKGNNQIDLVLPLIHGPYGEDGRLQGMLDMIGVSYVFSGVLAQAIGMNKPKAKIIAKAAGVPVAKDILFKKNEIDKETEFPIGNSVSLDVKGLIDELKLPVVIKPAEMGSSVGVSIAKDEEALKKGVEDAFRHGDEILLEEYIQGRELTVTVMGNKNPHVLAITEIIPVISEFYDYKAKYEKGGSKHVCPAGIPRETAQEIESYAIKTFQAIGCHDLARVDFMWDETNHKIAFIEINTIPGMTSTSLAPEAAKSAGMEFGEFLDRLIDEARSRHLLC